MNENLTNVLGADAELFQNTISQAMAQALRTLPDKQASSWIGKLTDFINGQPILFLTIAVVVLVVLFAIIREALCSYFKINEVLARLKKLEDKE